MFYIGKRFFYGFKINGFACISKIIAFKMLALKARGNDLSVSHHKESLIV
jgi:hypothetical protein